MTIEPEVMASIQKKSAELYEKIVETSKLKMALAEVRVDRTAKASEVSDAAIAFRRQEAALKACLDELMDMHAKVFKDGANQ